MNAGLPPRLKDCAQVKFRLVSLIALTALGACRHSGDITSENGGGVYAVRSTCPIAGIPAGTGDITLFNPQGSTDARAIDVTASISQLRATCQTAGSDVVSTVTSCSSGNALRSSKRKMVRLTSCPGRFSAKRASKESLVTRMLSKATI